MPLHRQGFPAFVNGVLLKHDAPAGVLQDGDTIGFGGHDGSRPTATTITYRCEFANLPALVPVMPPPPPRPFAPAPAAATASTLSTSPTTAEPPEAAQQQSRKDKSSVACKRRRAEAAAAPCPSVPASLSGLMAQSALAREHAELVAPLSTEHRRWAQLVGWLCMVPL